MLIINCHFSRANDVEVKVKVSFFYGYKSSICYLIVTQFPEGRQHTLEHFTFPSLAYLDNH